MNTVTVAERGNFRHVRILRWIFTREADESVVCELALTGEDREYELRSPAEWNPLGIPVETFDDALSAFERHAMIERKLLDDGWVLGQFESEKVTVH
jgi:hypothetical protein